MLRVEGLHTFYGAIEALKGVDLHVEQGEIVTLIGANGAGKSTLLMTICGVARARRGRVTLEDADITAERTDMIVRPGIACSPAERRTFPRSTILGNLTLGAHTDAPGRHTDHPEGVFTVF